MSRKNKNKTGQKIILTKNKGGKSRTVDMSVDPSANQPWPGFKELAEHINAECYQLAVEFEWLFQQHDLRKVELDSFFMRLSELASEDDESEALLMKCFDGAVLGPLRDLCQKLANLHAELVQSEQSDMRAVLRHAASADESNFGKMLRAFEQKVEAILSLNRQDAEGRSAIAAVLEATNRCAAHAEQIRRHMAGQRIEDGKQRPGLEQELDELVRQTARELADDNSPLQSRVELEKRWEQLEHMLESYRQAKRQLVCAREEYDANARRFFTEHDSLSLYKGEWHRQKESIRYAEDFFKAAGLDPFELSDRLSGQDRKSIFSMPDAEERVRLEATTPDPFPTQQESRVEERVQNTIKEVVAAIDALDKLPPMPPETCPVTLSELAVCTYAAFVARYPNGKPHPKSGRTVRKVHEAMLVPAQLTYGCTDEQFKDAVKEAEDKGWLQCFKRKAAGGKAWYACYQPTVEGFAHAETLYPKLPEDFCSRIFARHEALREEAANFRKSLREKDQQTPSS